MSASPLPQPAPPPVERTPAQPTDQAESSDPGRWVPGNQGVLYIHSLSELLDFLKFTLNGSFAGSKAARKINEVRMAPGVSFHRRREPRSQPPPADQATGSSLSAQGFRSAAGGHATDGAQTSPSFQALSEGWDHFLPAQFFSDLEAAIKQVATQLLLLAFHTHHDVTNAASDEQPASGYHAILPEWGCSHPTDIRSRRPRS